MNTGWAGPSPRCVVEAVTRALEQECFGGPTAPPLLEERRELGRRARRAVAELLGVRPEEISLQQNTTEGINIVLNGLDLRPGDELITCSLEHSSVIVPCYFARDRRQLNLRIVELDANDPPGAIVEKFAAAITPRTRLFVLSHISFSHGVLLPLKEICRLAHERGTFVLADGAQSAGQIPVDVVDLGCDFYAIPGHKWLLGPAGTGALYINGALIRDVQPSKVAHHAIEFFSYAGVYQPRTDIIQKFELTTSSIPLFVGLTEAIAFARGIGLAAIQERVLRLSDLARRRLAEIPSVRLVSPAGGPLATGLVSFTVEGVAPQDVTASLWELGRVVGRTVCEAGATRVCTHFFNTEQEVETVVDIVRQVADQGLPPGLPSRVEGVLPSTKMEKAAFWDL
jgi:L-cysteine/cystine lyase